MATRMARRAAPRRACERALCDRAVPLDRRFAGRALAPHSEHPFRSLARRPALCLPPGGETSGLHAPRHADRCPRRRRCRRRVRHDRCRPRPAAALRGSVAARLRLADAARAQHVRDRGDPVRLPVLAAGAQLLVACPRLDRNVHADRHRRSGTRPRLSRHGLTPSDARHCATHRPRIRSGRGLVGCGARRDSRRRRLAQAVRRR